MSAAEPEPATPARPAAPRASARIGMRGGLGWQRAKAAGEKRAEAERRVSRAMWRSVAIGGAVGVALYVVARLVILAR